MRGKQRYRKAFQTSGRITPAHAGKTKRIRKAEEILADHPRACGENLFGSATMNHGAGSPPRMRGKQALYVVPRKQIRITPAHAGKTLSVIIFFMLVADHPRACGENTSEMAYFRG